MEWFQVNGKPFFPVGAQAHNSSSYRREDLEAAAKAAALAGCNTLEAPVYWDIVEPGEGVFDFSMVANMLEVCRARDMRLIILWFASWKNGEMHYCPEYVKQDMVRFPRAISAEGVPVWDLSPYSESNRNADAAAFARLMAYLKENDSAQQTVIAVQVQNEPGTLRTDRDYSEAALEAHKGEVPPELLAFIRGEPGCEAYSILQKHGMPESGSWDTCFGYRGAEFCDTWAMARYIDYVAEKGKAEYNLPMLVNVWVAEHNWRIPGINYPGGGAIPLVLPLWKCVAKHIDIIAPDLYAQNYERFKRFCDVYDRADNPLMVPESGRSGKSARYIFHAVGEHRCAGYSMFGVEDLVGSDGELLPESKALADSFHSLRDALPLYYKYRGSDKIHAVVQDSYIAADTFEFERYLGCVPYQKTSPRDFRRDHLNPSPSPEEPWQCGLIFEESPTLLYLAGNFHLRLSPKSSPSWNLVDRDMQACEFLSVEEGHFDEAGEFVCDRRRNGDEVVFGGFWVTTASRIVRVRLL
jgi:hypothetical protein